MAIICTETGQEHINKVSHLNALSMICCFYLVAKFFSVPTVLHPNDECRGESPKSIRGDKVLKDEENKHFDAMWEVKEEKRLPEAWLEEAN